jgi:hypothetical protein
MVDPVLLQSLSYMVTAAGVAVAATYYVMTLRETKINRRITLTNSLMYPLFHTEEGMRKLVDLVQMQWNDYDDFKRKYDSTVNPENMAKRISVWNIYDSIGYQLRLGLLDVDSIYRAGGAYVINMWIKFKPIIEEYRKTDYGNDTYSDFEYLVKEMARIKSQRDPSWKGSPSYFKPDEYDRVLKK